MGSRSYRDLIAWQKAMKLAKMVYAATSKFPEEEGYGLVSQMRRASVSIPSNIAEGQARISTPEFRRFLTYSKGSLAELETQIQLSQDFGFLTDEQCNSILALCEQVQQLVAALSRSLHEKRKTQNEKRT